MYSSKIKPNNNLMIMFVIKILQFCMFDFKRSCLNLCDAVQPDTQFKLQQNAIQLSKRKITAFMDDCLA